MSKVDINGVVRDATPEEQARIDAREQAWINNTLKRKLNYVRKHRQKFLDDSDWWVSSGQITDAQKTWRQSLRDIPTNYTTETELDSLLEIKDDKVTLKHSIWSKP